MAFLRETAHLLVFIWIIGVLVCVKCSVFLPPFSHEIPEPSAAANFFRSISEKISFPFYDKPVCRTEACQRTGEEMLSAIDESVDPCDDFYAYACNNWIENNPIPDNRTDISKFSMLSDKLVRLKQDMLGRKNPKEFSSETKAKKFYSQCLDQRAMEKLRSKPLLDSLDSMLGGWPVLTPDWDPNSFDLFDTSTRIREYGIEPFISLAVDANAFEPSENVIFLLEPKTFISRDVLDSETGIEFVESYRTFLYNITAFMRRDSTRKRSKSVINEDLDDIIQLGTQLAAIESTTTERRDISRLTNKATLGETQRKMHFKSDFLQRLTEYVTEIFRSVDLADEITESTTYMLTCTTYLEKLDAKLFEIQGLPGGKRLLANYIGFRIVSYYFDRLSKEFRDAFDEHTQRISGRKTKENKSVAEECASVVVNEMPLVTSAMYVRDHMEKNAKKAAATMVKDLKDGMKHLLRSATWMDTATSQEAFKKLGAMADLVGYHDLLVNNVSAIDEEYSEITIGSSYFTTLHEVDRHDNLKYLRKLIKKNKRNDAIADATDIMQANAYQDLIQNRIVIYASLLQPPFYDPVAPQYTNYGGIGYFIGHEVTHGFDDQGSAFDQYGHYKSWWTEETTKAFVARTQALVSQYNQYSTPSGNVNGEMTVGENIADNGGLKAAYHAYSEYRKRSGKKDPLLPGLEKYSTEQLFFISAGQVWCSSERPESARITLLTDVHSPDKYRVNGPMSNMPEFAKAFGCPLGSKMNPKSKNVVW